MNAPVLAIFFVAALYLTIRRGAGAAFMYVMLPAELLFSQIPAISIEPLPDFETLSTCSYAILLGLACRLRLPPLKLHPIDFGVILTTISMMFTGYSTGVLWTSVAQFGEQTLNWLVPYLAARLAFSDMKLRRHGAYIVAVVAMIIAFFALVEFRLNPYCYSRFLEPLTLSGAANKGVLGRSGFFRAMSSFAHPIDLGNCGLLISGLVGVLSFTSGLKWKHPLVLGGLLSGPAMIMASISFSSMFGATVAIAIFLLLRLLRGSGILLPAVVVLIAIGLTFMTYRLMSVDTSIRITFTGQSSISDSYWVRALIAQNAMPYVQTAGFFGYGANVTKTDLNLESVDNSYILFIMRRGWVYLAIFFCLCMTMAFTGYRLLRRRDELPVRIPVAIGLAVLFGTLIAMYTVWFGFVYSVLWTWMLGFMTTMAQLVSGRVRQTGMLPVAPPRPGGFPVVLPQRRPVMPGSSTVASMEGRV
ncbi:MAG: hypothetical protein QM770_24210 [Tepidisphaeraceae bacterium]